MIRDPTGRSLPVVEWSRSEAAPQLLVSARCRSDLLCPSSVFCRLCSLAIGEAFREEAEPMGSGVFHEQIDEDLGDVGHRRATRARPCRTRARGLTAGPV